MIESRINIARARSGMQLSRAVYEDEQTLLLPKKIILTPKMIMRLKLCGVEEIWVDGQIASSQPLSNEESAYLEQIKRSQSYIKFEHAHKKSVDSVKKALNAFILNNQEIEVAQLIEEVDHILEDIHNGMQVFEMLQCIKLYDDSTYVHSVNVALICNVMGKWLHFSEEDIEVLTLCGMLHDVGKLLMPPEIIKKTGRLTTVEYATIKTHPYVGYTIIEGEDIDERVKQAVLQHHEKCDGSGYPNHLKAYQIAPFSKIVTIADIYDAMTANRVYREGLCPFDVIELFEQEGLQKYEPLYVMTFLKHIADSYINCPVRLSNKKQGHVVMINRSALAHPVVRVDESYIDLSKMKGLSIEAIL